MRRPALDLREREWRQRIADRLRNSEAALDPLAVARLRAARLRAVAAAHRRGRMPWILAATLAASLTAYALLVRSTVAPHVNAVPASSLDLLTDELGPDFYDEVELYRWLEEDVSH